MCFDKNLFNQLSLAQFGFSPMLPQNCSKPPKNAQLDAIASAAAAMGHLAPPFARFNPLALEKLVASQQQRATPSVTSDKALSVMRLDFRREDLDLVLFGSVKPAEEKREATSGVALSGLRIGELSYGEI